MTEAVKDKHLHRGASILKSISVTDRAGLNPNIVDTYVDPNPDLRYDFNPDPQKFMESKGGISNAYGSSF